jgi:hypothetical protein
VSHSVLPILFLIFLSSLLMWFEELQNKYE